MTDHQDRRSRYFEDREKATAAYTERSFEYEKLAIDFAHAAFKVLTYLNGGALVAIPAALTLLNWKAADHKIELFRLAGCFVTGLIFILLSQMFAFFTMARRSEAQQWLADREAWNSAMTHYPEQFEYKTTKAKADSAGATANTKIARSNLVRAAAVVFAWLSAFAFAGGCIYAAFVLTV